MTGLVKMGTKTGAVLALYHRERSQKARQALLATLRVIEADIATYGYYSDPSDLDKPLRLSMAEVQRRAGLGAAFLRNQRHHDLRETVLDWLSGQKKSFETSKTGGQKKKRERISYYEDVLKKVSSEGQDWLIERARLTMELSKLKGEIELVRARSNVVGIHKDKEN